MNGEVKLLEIKKKKWGGGGGVASGGGGGGQGRCERKSEVFVKIQIRIH